MEEPAALFDEDVPGFPGCARCSHHLSGPIEQCVTCAHRTLTSREAPSCELCAQLLMGKDPCHNRLCREPWRREFTRVRAIAMKQEGGPLERTIHAYKYEGKWGRKVIFARLLLGWLAQAIDPSEVDLIVASPTPTGPPERRFPHTEAVIDSAALQDVRRLRPFDQNEPRAIVAVGQRTRSAGSSLADKRAAAIQLVPLLRVPEPTLLTGRRVLVYDDVLTTGETMNVIAGALRGAGAVEVSGVVLARQAW